jgi:tetratricopeptide (TPR) repeat protein
MPRVPRTLALLILILGTLSAIPAALAGPLSKPTAPRARDHLAHGNRLYGIRSFDEAIVEYKAGALIEPAPVFDYNLGQCFRQLGQYKEAIWHYERFLTRGKPEGEVLEAVTRFIAQMKAELDKQAMTQKPVEPAPPPGVRLRDEPVDRAEPWYQDRWGWALTGAGLAGVAVGGGLLINASNLEADASDATNQQDRERWKDRQRSRATLGTIVGLGGVSLLVAGVVKLAVYPREQERTARWHVAVSGNGVMVFGQF